MADQVEVRFLSAIRKAEEAKEFERVAELKSLLADYKDLKAKEKK
jgi:hypothetical protein